MPESAAAKTCVPSAGRRSGYDFGTFQGVFMPSMLTILGVIMFLRFRWVLGSVGLGGTLVIVTLSVAITLLTGLSIAAMATNMRVGGGGAYCLTSPRWASARMVLEALARRRPDARSWNPNVLVLSDAPTSRWHLVVIGRALAGESGLLAIASVVPDDPSIGTDRLDGLRRAIEEYLSAQRVAALVKVESEADVGDGLISLVKSYGFGPLVPNTVMLGQAVSPRDPRKHAELLATVQRRHRNLIVVHEGEDLPEVRQARRIDVWWRGHRRNLGLMLALAFLLRKGEIWADAEIVVWRVVPSEDEILPATRELDALLAETRFPARVQVVCRDGDPFPTIRRHAREAELLFLGLRSIGEEASLDDYAAYYASLATNTDGLPPTALVHAGEDVDLHRLFAGV